MDNEQIQEEAGTLTSTLCQHYVRAQEWKPGTLSFPVLHHFTWELLVELCQLHSEVSQRRIRFPGREMLSPWKWTAQLLLRLTGLRCLYRNPDNHFSDLIQPSSSTWMMLEGDPSTSQPSTHACVYILLNPWGLSTSLNILLTRSKTLGMGWSF